MTETNDYVRLEPPQNGFVPLSQTAGPGCASSLGPSGLCGWEWALPRESQRTGHPEGAGTPCPWLLVSASTVVTGENEFHPRQTTESGVPPPRRGPGGEEGGGHQPHRAPEDTGRCRPAHGRPPSHAQARSDLAVRLASHTPACLSSLSASILGWLGLVPVGTWALSRPQLALQA